MNLYAAAALPFTNLYAVANRSEDAYLTNLNDGVITGTKEEMEALAEKMNTGPLTLAVTNFSTNYRVTWEGVDDEHIDTSAVEWADSHRKTHMLSEVDHPVNWSRFPRLFDLLYGKCEHGLSANLCAGFGHFSQGYGLKYPV